MVEDIPETEDYAEYEILPHKEIKELKEELAKLKEYEVTPTRKLQISILELNNKLDRLLAIFEEAMHGIKVEEGGLRFEEKMRPMVERMNKILEQHKDIAEGVVAMADMLKEIKKTGPAMPPLGPPKGQMHGMMPPGRLGMPPQMGGLQRGPVARVPPPPPPKRTIAS